MKDLIVGIVIGAAAGAAFSNPTVKKAMGEVKCKIKDEWSKNMTGGNMGNTSGGEHQDNAAGFTQNDN